MSHDNFTTVCGWNQIEYPTQTTPNHPIQTLSYDELRKRVIEEESEVSSQTAHSSSMSNKMDIDIIQQKLSKYGYISLTQEEINFRSLYKDLIKSSPSSLPALRKSEGVTIIYDDKEREFKTLEEAIEFLSRINKIYI